MTKRMRRDHTPAVKEAVDQVTKWEARLVDGASIVFDGGSATPPIDVKISVVHALRCRVIVVRAAVALPLGG